MNENRDFEKGAIVQKSPEHDIQQSHDDIYNVRPWNIPLDRLQSAVSTLGEADEDPGLRKPGDYKQPQVRDTQAALTIILSINRFSGEGCFSGSPINQLVLYTVTLVPVLFMFTRQHSVRHLPVKISLGCSP